MTTKTGQPCQFLSRLRYDTELTEPKNESHISESFLESAPSASLYSSLHPHSSSVIHRKPFSTGVRKTVFSCWREPGELTDKNFPRTKKATPGRAA